MQQQPVVSIDFFAGNYITGVFCSKTEVMKSAEDAYGVNGEEIVDNLLNSVGWETAVWATYTDGKSFDEHTADFRRYMDHVKKRRGT